LSQYSSDDFTIICFTVKKVFTVATSTNPRSDRIHAAEAINKMLQQNAFTHE